MYIILHGCVREISGCPEDQLLPRFGVLCSRRGFVQPPAADPMGPCLPGQQRVQHAHAGMALCAARPAGTHMCHFPMWGRTRTPTWPAAHVHVATSYQTSLTRQASKHAQCSSSKVNRRTGELSHVLYIMHVMES